LEVLEVAAARPMRNEVIIDDPDFFVEILKAADSIDATLKEVNVTLSIGEATLDRGEIPARGVQATLLSDQDGSSLGQAATSDDQGRVTFQLVPQARYGVKLARPGDVDSYAFGMVAYDDSPQSVNIFSQAVIDKILALTGGQQDPGRGMILGAVGWGTPDGSVGGPIGCAQVRSEPAGQVFYFGEKGPASPEQQPHTSHGKSDFLLLNLPEGRVTLKAEVGGVQVAAGTGLVFKGGVTFRAEAFGTAAADPTPEGCR
jgi:hypothetical protein